MAQNKKGKKEVQKKSYKNPTKTKWGQILILVLAAAMVLGSIATLIYYIVTNATSV